jgi:hypothetical protein
MEASMPDAPLPLKSATPSKRRENQEAATLSRSQPSTVEEVQARHGQPATSAEPEELDEQPEGEV